MFPEESVGSSFFMANQLKEFANNNPQMMTTSDEN
jgi:hypothetical protein